MNNIRNVVLKVPDKPVNMAQVPQGMKLQSEISIDIVSE